VSAVLNTLRQLEEYVALTGDATNTPVWELTLAKLISQETARLQEQKARLQAQLEAFERRYAMPSRVFYSRFERGELGDEMDFIEWAATQEMVQNLDRYLQILSKNPSTDELHHLQTL